MKANLPKGIGGGPSNMQGMIKQAQKLQEQMEEKQAELAEREYDVKAGGGMVTVKITGRRVVRNIEINPEIVDPDDIETMQDIIVAAVNEAIRRVDEDSEKEMSAITGNVPGMGNIPGLF